MINDMNDFGEVPYLSIVTSSRNDDHGGNMFKRTQTTLSSVIDQLEKYKLKSEIIFTDYNSPPEKPFLKDVLLWPVQTKYCSIRSIIVSPSIHQRFDDSGKMPYNFSLAQNVGLRRARGKFVLVTSIDILFSNDLIELIARKTLQDDKIYRTDRQDVSKKVLEIPSLSERLEFCRKNVIWIHTRNISVPVLRRKRHHLRSENLDFNAKITDFPNLHLNGADLLLMSKESWHSLRGFPERDNLGLGVEILLCNMAYLKGFEEKILPEQCSIYHIDHESRWRNTSPGLCDKILFYCFTDKLASQLMFCLEDLNIGTIKRKLTPGIFRKKSKEESFKVSSLACQHYWQVLYEMKNGKRPVAYNHEDWGLGAEDLEQYLIRRADWDYQADLTDARSTMEKLL
jgi:hypothetical protein